MAAPVHSRRSVNRWPNFWRPLIAVVIGNAIFFLLVSPRLPETARHHRFAIDLGLVIDFWVCLVVYGLVLLIGKKGSGKPAK
jgi:hypothetical protein